jgi:hypothetical protein
MDSALKATFVSALRALGFKGSYPHFRRLIDSRVDLVGLQFSQWGPQFYVEIGRGSSSGIEVGGKLIPAADQKYYHGWPRVRLGGRFDFEVGSVGDVAERVAQLTPEIESWFRANEA